MERTTRPEWPGNCSCAAMCCAIIGHVRNICIYQTLPQQQWFYLCRCEIFLFVIASYCFMFTAVLPGICETQQRPGHISNASSPTAAARPAIIIPRCNHKNHPQFLVYLHFRRRCSFYMLPDCILQTQVFVFA